MRPLPQLPRPQSEYLVFQGGYDTETPRWEVRPGKVRQSQNYEIGVNGGYQDLRGYERYDGQTSPSSATYAIFDVTISGSVSVGDTITQQNTGATAVVLAGVESETPAYLVITKISGTFNDSDDLEVSSSVEASPVNAPIIGGASTPKLNAEYTNLAADEYRDDIDAVPGSGAVLGIERLDDVLYAFRNNAGGTAADLYKSASSGWTQVSLGRELEFTSGGTYEIEEGDTITGATSGATATITRVVLESGSWSGGDAAGRLIFASQTGTFQSENLDVGANANVAAIAGDSDAITLDPDGSYEFDIANFGGQSGTERIYGCDGVNRGFEFDGTVFVPISTGMTVDKPTHVHVHKKHLFFSFAGSAQHSGIGTPYIWSPIFGAAEIATGDTITGFQTEPGSEGNAALGIYNRNRIHILYGNDSSDWNLVRYKKEVGAYVGSIQQFGFTIFLDDRGITNLQTTQRFGNFVHATISSEIQRYLNERRTTVTASCIVRDKSQYRLFFNDGAAVYITTSNNKILGIMPQLLADPVRCITSRENNTGNEEIFFGSDEGFVYQMEKGTSFDGDSIEAYMVFHYNFLGSLRVLKKFTEATLETEGETYAEFNFSYELGYSDTSVPQPLPTTVTLNYSPAFWDSFTWDNFTWDGQALAPSVTKISGTAENIALVIRKNSDQFAPVRLSGANLFYQPRRRMRS